MDTALAEFRINLYNKMALKFKYAKCNEVMHNHPPLPYIVDSCPYCKQFGNTFFKCVKQPIVQE